MELTGRRILVVEDDHYLADELCQRLRKEGAVVLGPAPTPYYATHLLGRRGVDAAVLDVWLHGAPVFDLADDLVRRGTPIVFATAYAEEELPARFRALPRIIKPYDQAKVLEALEKAGIGQRLEPALTPASVIKRPETDGARSDLDNRTRMIRAMCTVMRRNAQRHGAEHDPVDNRAKIRPASAAHPGRAG